MALEKLSTGIWRIVVGAIVAGIVSVGGWIFAEVRSLPATYQTVEKHDKDTKELRKEQMEQTTRIEEKVDEINTFLRDHFSRNNP